MRRRSILPASKLKQKAWEQFSEYIKRRDKGVCFTCAAIGDPKYMHSGHFIHRRAATYFNEINVHCQCPHCNIWLYGNSVLYTLKMIEKYGKKIVDELWVESRSIKPFVRSELEEIYLKYKKLNESART